MKQLRNKMLKVLNKNEGGMYIDHAALVTNIDLDIVPMIVIYFLGT